MSTIDPLVLALRQERQRRRLTYEALGRLAYVSKNGLCDIEKGHRSPTLFTVRLILAALGMDVHLRPVAARVPATAQMDGLRPCGTPAAHRRHITGGGDPCDECREAENERKRRYRARRRHRSTGTGWPA